MAIKKPPKGSEHLCGFKTSAGIPCRRRVKRARDRCYSHRAVSPQTKRQKSPQVKSKPVNGAHTRSDDITVAVVNQMVDANKFGLLELTLEQAGFWHRVESVRDSCSVSKTDFRIIIKPDMECFDIGTPTGADPELVEHLIALLYRRGYDQVVVADGLGSADVWLENRELAILADLIGYRYVTDDNTPYDIVNLSEDVIDGGFSETGVLARSPLGRAWVEAHFRISLSKNKTHEEYAYSLGLQNLLGVLPLRDKEYHYCHRFDPGDVCLELLSRTPVHFSLIDAVVSNHGSDGIRSTTPLATHTIIASENLLLTDWVAALKMGVDPYASPLHAKAFEVIGLPKPYAIKGDLSPYPGWKNVPMILSDSVRRRNSSVLIRQIIRPWFQSVNRELFPFRNPVDDRMNSFMGRFFSGTDRSPLTLASSVGLNYFLAGLHDLMACYEIMYDKDRVRRKQASLGLDLETYHPGDYEAIVDYIEPLARIVAHTPSDRNGLRWRYIDGSVLFEFSRHLPIRYDEFVTRVDISSAVRMMNDNIGGACVPVSRDKSGRIIYQAERDIYLPQPNWIAIFGGKMIDVGKLEFIRYEKDCHQIFWRTVASANHSATFDDGVVSFARDEAGTTKITIVARQQFALPLFWQVIPLDYFPQIKDVLVSEAYTTFFSRTLANLEAAFEGRDPGTGRGWDESYGELDSDSDKPPLEQIAEAFVKLVGFIEPLLTTCLDRKNTPHANGFGFNVSNGSQDKHGDNVSFGLFAGPLRTFLTDLVEAVKKDMGMTYRMSQEDEK
jgi:uncharacterized protein (DUF362 family)